MSPEFEKEEQKRMEEQMSKYAKELERETNKEKEKHEKNLDALNKRKDELIKERRNKMKVSDKEITFQNSYFKKKNKSGLKKIGYICVSLILCTLEPFLAHLDEVQKELLYYPRHRRWRRCWHWPRRR